MNIIARKFVHPKNPDFPTDTNHLSISCVFYLLALTSNIVIYGICSSTNISICVRSGVVIHDHHLFWPNWDIRLRNSGTSVNVV